MAEWIKVAAVGEIASGGCKVSDVDDLGGFTVELAP